MSFVYHICNREDEGLLHKGYIGITDDFTERFSKHCGGFGNPFIFHSLNKHREISYSILFEGSRESCLFLEFLLRPFDKVGWNLVKGGGDPPRHTGKRKESWGAAISISQKKSMRAKSAEVWVCDGLVFESKLEASEHFGVTRKTIKDRCDNPKFTQWYRKVK